ncbi:Fc.00g115210.m01.CDS01 [Cosmosporella sp. VM-42]
MLPRPKVAGAGSMERDEMEGGIASPPRASGHQLASESPSTAWDDECEDSGSTDGWDMIAWSESASPVVDSPSIGQHRERVIEMTRDAESNFPDLQHENNGINVNRVGMVPDLLSQDQVPWESALDSLPEGIFDADPQFDFDLDFVPTLRARPDELDGVLNEPTELACPGSYLSTPGNDVLSSYDASFIQPPLVVDPADLAIHRFEAGTTLVHDGSELAEWFPVDSVSLSPLPGVLTPSATLTPQGPNSADPNKSGGGPSTRRRPRSPSPSPDDVQRRIAESTFCFQIQMPEQGSTRPTKKMRGPNDEQRRRETAEVRKLGACLRCRLQKAKCDGKTPCSECIRVHGKERLCKAVCERLNIREAIAFRIGNSKFKQETATVRPYPVWVPTSTTRTITLIRPNHASSHWPKGAAMPKLEISVREFVPSASDITTERWRSGHNEVILELPAFSAYDNKATSSALLDWVDRNFEHYAKDMTAQAGDFLIGMTFDEALRYVSKHPDSMVKSALNLWIGARMAQEFFCVAEDNDLEIAVVNDQNSIHHGQCPVPPVLDHQLDVLMIQEMIRMKDEIFTKIEGILKARNSRSKWYEIYLTIFVLLANLQYVYKSQQRWWKMHFNTGKGNAIGQAYQSISYQFMQRYAFSAQNLLSHFRYGLKGPVPFSLDWDKENVRKLADLDKDAIKYVKYVSANVRRRKAEFTQIAKRVEEGEYEGEMFWISQLFINLSLND